MKAMELAVAQEDSCCKIPISLTTQGQILTYCNRLWVLKNSLRLIAADDAMVAARFMQSIFQSRGGEPENYSAVKLSMLLL